MRAAEGGWNSERLAIGHDNVGAVVAGRPEQAERDRVGHDDEQRAGRVNRVGEPSTGSQPPKKFGFWMTSAAVSPSSST
jgi:hypothetical protein